MEGDDSLVTRVFVTGLPPNLTNDDLAKHFSSRFQITDAQVVPRRRIGFVGFKDHAVAKDAVKYFNKTFIRLSKIGVDFARPVDLERHDGQQARPTTRRNGHPRESALTSSTSAGRSPQIHESPKVGLKRKRDDGNGVDVAPSPAPGDRPAIKDSEGGDRKVLSEVGTESSSADPPADLGQSSSERPDKGPAVDNLPDETVADDDAWLRSKTSRVLDLGDASASQVDVKPLQAESASDEPKPGITASESADEDKAEPEHLGEAAYTTRRLFIRNLPYTTEDFDIRELFSSRLPGKIEEVHVVKDHRTNVNKGFAYVTFRDVESAQDAAVAFDGKPMQGRILHVLPATEKTTKKLDDYELSKLPLKKQKLIKRKMEAGSATLTWNSLYMNADSVISSIADRLGVAKSQVLDPTSSDAAVKQAQAETHVIQETKAYFQKYGVDFDSFKDKPRGGRALLVKNLSYGTSAEDLKALFNACGEVTRILLPPSGVIAIVEFTEDDQAQRALKQLAYRNLKGSVLYLEKSPKDLFSNTLSTPTGEERPEDRPGVDDGIGEDLPSTASYTLFVRNLNFSTTSSALAGAFRPLEGFLSAKIKTRTDPKRPGEILSMGYGFVDFRTKENAHVALKAMNGYRLDNHEILVKFSQLSTDAAEERRREDLAKKNADKKTKIIIKNLPFETTKKDIRALFSAYGQLRSVRVPKKFDRSTRGFAFAEFVTAREAEFAMDALKNTHLLGRRLVLEFAQGDATDPEEEIRAMEKKMGAQAEKVELSRITGPGRKKFVVGARDDMDQG